MSPKKFKEIVQNRNFRHRKFIQNRHHSDLRSDSFLYSFSENTKKKKKIMKGVESESSSALFYYEIILYSKRTGQPKVQYCEFCWGITSSWWSNYQTVQQNCVLVTLFFLLYHETINLCQVHGHQMQYIMCRRLNKKMRTIIFQHKLQQSQHTQKKEYSTSCRHRLKQ